MCTPLLVRINGKWVNLEAWKKFHPGGPESMERFRENDATDAFVSLHGPKAFEMLAKMKAVREPSNFKERPETPATIAFRQWREDLVKEGMFERNWAWDACYIGIIITLAFVGTLLAFDYPLLATVMIGLAMQQAGWCGHDYVHGRGDTSYVLGRLLGGTINAFSSEWWSTKHNKHHVHTNQVGIDDDIANDPILHLYIPAADKDVPFRAYQHFYYHLVYAFLYVSWRIQSFQTAWARKDKIELILMAINYSWLTYLPWKVAIGSVLLGGWLVAEIVTASHQSEDMKDGQSYDFCEDQFSTTRDVHMNSMFMNWLWGGMQYQLIHHLFPTMPKYRYASMVDRIRKFALANGLEYRTAGLFEILTMNYNTMKKYAALHQ
eukprot:TRINITY_DN14860_c0_g1_i1.p1 TRINITY_DN14860_c0_g1~~TRINITY_DN14860_c0_g1_i1.p1  ORF type:complete len:378 (-),score=108.20 TRINITY_DN14860_c0_g1_i1:94-1227(-)